MSEPTYVMQQGRYAFYLQDKCLFETDEVAILFDKAASVLLKHGPPDVVRAAYDRMWQAFRAAGQSDLADDLLVIQGRFDIEELHKVINISGYIGRMYARLVAETSTIEMES